MNLLAFMQGYMTKKAEDMPSMGNPVPTMEPVLPETPEEAEALLEAKKLAKAKKKEARKEVRKDVAELDAQLAVLRALKKKKEASLIT
jgi:cbb3-type cytochrome oxidase cytochrome c subunit